jgi:hypothetical protein
LLWKTTYKFEVTMLCPWTDLEGISLLLEMTDVFTQWCHCFYDSYLAKITSAHLTSLSTHVAGNTNLKCCHRFSMWITVHVCIASVSTCNLILHRRGTTVTTHVMFQFNQNLLHPLRLGIPNRDYSCVVNCFNDLGCTWNLLKKKWHYC